MVSLVMAVILALSAVAVLLFPQLVNVLSEEEKKRMNRRKVAWIAFVGLMTPALILFGLFLSGVDGELVSGFIVFPFAIGTAVAIQCSLPPKRK